MLGCCPTVVRVAWVPGHGAGVAGEVSWIYKEMLERRTELRRTDHGSQREGSAGPGCICYHSPLLLWTLPETTGLFSNLYFRYEVCDSVIV